MNAKSFLKQILLLLFLAALNGFAMAQADPPAIADILGATNATDKSVAVFTYVLGDFFLRPLSTFGGASTLVGGLFLIFNGFVFVVGTLWASYGLISGIVETAHSGEVLGKRLSAVWLPIRMVTGITGIAPVFGGYSLGQVFIVTMAALGIGVANKMWTGAIDMTSEFEVIVPPSAALSAASPTGVDSAARGMFEIHVCDEAMRALNAQVGSIDTYGKNLNPRAFLTGAGVGGYILAFSSFGTQSNPSLCGASALRGVHVRGASSIAGGFRVSAVDYAQYAALADRMHTAAASAYDALDQKIATIAEIWHRDYLAAVSQADGVVPEYPKAELAGAVSAYQAAMLAQMRALSTEQLARGNALAPEVKSQMRTDGWFGAGSWFATFAEANAAMADVMNSVSIQVAPPGKTTGAVGATLVAIRNSQNKSGQANLDATAAGTGDGFGAVNESLCSRLGLNTATGNCSLGQAIVEKGIQAAAIGSGGGGGGGSTGLINPIVMFKNMGDYTVMMGEALVVIMAQLDGSGATDIAEGKGLLGTVGKIAAGSFPGGALLLGFINGVSKILPFVAGALIVLGLMMSIYIPLIPFITWMGGLIQYCVIVMQGLVGAPIAALSHLDAEGEGLGRRTEAGYIFVLNVTFRPALMLLGFFFASAIMIVLGSFQANLFITAMANAQGNSITGLLSIPAYLGVFFVLNMMMIQSLFNMIFLLPDQILSLIGSGGHMADLGKEAEGKVHSLFIAGARMANGAGAAARAVGDKAKKPTPDAGGQKGGGEKSRG